MIQDTSETTDANGGGSAVAVVDEPMLSDAWDVATVDFTVTPPAGVGATLTVNQSHFQDGHSILGPGASVAFSFQLTTSEVAQALDIALVGLVSRNGPDDGFAPVTLTVNGVVCAQDFTVPGGGYGPRTCVFHVPPAALQPITNTVALTVSPSAVTYFWLYSLGARQSPTPYPGSVLTAAFSSAPPTLSPGWALTANQGMPAGDHAAFNRGAHCVFTFDLDHTNASNDELVVGIYALVSRSETGPGYAPVDVIVNGAVLAGGLSISPAGYGPEWVELRAPASVLRAQGNTLEIRSSTASATMFWLYAVNVTKFEYYEERDFADFSVNPPNLSGVTVSTQNVQSSGDHLAVNTNGSITVGFSHFGGLPLFVEVNALVSRLSTGPGYAPFSLSLNGTAFVTDYTVPGGGYGYADNVFVVPGALVRDGANQLVLSVGSSQSFLWVRAVELLAIFDGPNYSTSLGTAATSYSARNDINQVPLAFLLAYPSAMLTTLDRVLEMDDSLTLHAAIAAMQQMTQFWPWIVQQVTSALSAGSLQLSDTTISSGTQAAADLLNVVGYVTTRGAQELDRLLAIDHGKPATLDYTRGANVEPLIQARLAQIGPVQPAGTAFAFTDDATGTTYTFATATVAANKRTAYAGLIRCGIVQANLEQVDASLARLAAGVPSPEAIAFLPAIAIALVAIGIYALASQYLISQSLPPAEGPKAYKMNWHGWIDDWTSPISYGWWDIPGAGYLKPGNVWNVRLPDGTRADESLASQAPGQNFGPIGGYFNYVWLPGDAYPLRLSYKNPALSPPGETYHSQLAGGAAVGCAGEIQFADGYFRLINTSSGHYYKTEPDWNRCRQQVIDAIAAMGYDMSKVGASAYTGLDLAFIDDFPVDGAGAQL